MSALYYMLVCISSHCMNICSLNTRKHGIGSLIERDEGA